MSKKEFLQALEQELQDLPLEEKKSAVQYFSMYFDDAGPEQEAEVIRQLGSPQKVAQEIREGGADTADGWVPAAKSLQLELPVPQAPQPPETAQDVTEYTELEGAPVDAPAGAGSPPPFTTQGNYPAVPPPPPPQQQKEPLTGGKLLLFIVLGIIFIGPIIGLIASLFAALIAAAVVMVVPLIVGVAFAASSVLIFICGAMLMPASVGSGLLTLGGGCVLLGLGLLACFFGAWLIGKVVPAMFRGTGKLMKKVFAR